MGARKKLPVLADCA